MSRTNLRDQGYRLVWRQNVIAGRAQVVWVNEYLVSSDDVDVTDLDDAEFEAFIRGRGA